MQRKARVEGDRHSDEVLVGGMRRGNDLFGKILTGADADDLAGLEDSRLHRAGFGKP